MTLVLLVLTPLAVLAGVAVIASRARGAGAPCELQGDWWAKFERDFHAYLLGLTETPRDA